MGGKCREYFIGKRYKIIRIGILLWNGNISVKLIIISYESNLFYFCCLVHASRICFSSSSLIWSVWRDISPRQVGYCPRRGRKDESCASYARASLRGLQSEKYVHFYSCKLWFNFHLFATKRKNCGVQSRRNIVHGWVNKRILWMYANVIYLVNAWASGNVNELFRSTLSVFFFF